MSNNYGGITIIKNTAARGIDPKKKLAALFFAAFLVLPTILGLAFSAGGLTQPPVDTTTLYSTTIAWGPAYADPGRAYDSASQELIFNCYDTLIRMGESVTNQYGTWDTYESYWAFEPSLATNVPTRQEVFMTFTDTGINLSDPINPPFWFQADTTWYHIEQWVNDNSTDDVLGPFDVVYVGEYTAQGLPLIDALTVRTWHIMSLIPGGLVTVHHYYYDFNIRTDPAISFVDNTDVAVDGFDVNDVEYTFEKACARSRLPTWMFNMPLFDQWYVSTDLGMGSAWASVFWAKMIQDAFEIVDTNVFRINVGFAFADGAFKQILAQTYGSIMSKEWCLSKGDFNLANFYVDSDLNGVMDWWQVGHANQVRGINAPYNIVQPNDYCGTGPYRVTTADPAIEMGKVVLQKNNLYWRGWAGKHVNTVQIDYVPDWTARKQLFLDGKADVTTVPKANMFELLDAYGDPIAPTITTVKNIGPVLKMNAVFYTWDIAPSPYYNPLYTGVFPTGAPTDFMNNVHVRNAFTYSFNRTKYIEQAWYGEGICRETPGILGLVPDYYTKGDGSSARPWKFNYNLTAMETELEQAYFVQGAENKSVWDWGGFHVDILYSAWGSGSAEGLIMCDLIKQGFDALNALSGKNFQITIVGWIPTLVLDDYYPADAFPVWTIGWLADYADSGNLYGPYMHSNGDFSFYQHYPPTALGPRTGLNKDQLVDFAFKTPDGPSRADVYADLDDIYLADNPGFPCAQPQSRRWQQYWVRGWYYNALYPSQYFYHVYKEDACWADVTGATSGVPDSKTDMRDISYIAGHFGAKAPNPAAIPPEPIYDPKWAPGRYGYGGCDLAGDRKVDMRDIAFATAHFLHENEP